MAKLKTLQTPKERLEYAKRLLKNAKEELKKAGTINGVGMYADYKYVSSASGMAFLSALEALKALFLNFKIFDDTEQMNRKLKKHSLYTQFLKRISQLGKDRDKLLYLFEAIYDILHLGGYYRELRSKKAIDDGFEKVEKLIRIVEKYVKQ